MRFHVLVWVLLFSSCKDEDEATVVSAPPLPTNTANDIIAPLPPDCVTLEKLAVELYRCEDALPHMKQLADPVRKWVADLKTVAPIDRYRLQCANYVKMVTHMIESAGCSTTPAAPDGIPVECHALKQALDDAIACKDKDLAKKAKAYLDENWKLVTDTPAKLRASQAGGCKQTASEITPKLVAAGCATHGP